MPTPSSSTTEHLRRLRTREGRAGAVLVFRGTGVNAWHYYPFLRHFSLGELREFAAIYGMSGGAAMVWFHVLAQTGLFDDAVGHDFDRVIRSTMNKRGALARLSRIARAQFPYDDEDVLRFLSALPTGAARDQTFAQLPLANFAVVAHEKRGNRLLVVDRRSHPDARVIEVLARAGTPHRGVDASREVGRGEMISDFDFAGGEVKQAFQRHVEAQHSGRRIYQVNMIREGVADRTVFVRACADRFPRWSQALDLVLLLAGLPNPRYRATYRRREPLRYA